jgi:hypothetical protein
MQKTRQDLGCHVSEDDWIELKLSGATRLTVGYNISKDQPIRTHLTIVEGLK